MELGEMARLVSSDMFLDPPLSVEELKTVSDFTLLWAIYEGRLYEARYESRHLPALVHTAVIRLAQLDAYWAYFHAQYVSSPALLNATFDQPVVSAQRAQDKAQVVAILAKEAPTEEERTIALLLLVAQLRHNLFRGISHVAASNLRRENLEMASKVLGDILRRIYFFSQH